MVVRNPLLDNRQIVSKIVTEFYRLPGVAHVESAITTNTIMIVYDNRRVSKKKIEDIFLKWGCNKLDISYSWLN